MKFVLYVAMVALYASAAHAEPISAVFTAIAASAASAAAGIASAIGGLVSFASLSAFLASPIGSLLVGIGLQLVTSLFVKKPQTPSIEAGKVNVRISEPERWICAGQGRQGGGVVFGEFDGNGNFWYVIVHADSYHKGIVKRYFDDIEITLDAGNWVITDEFCLDQDDDTYSGSSSGDTRKPYFKMFTTTHTRTNPVPPQIAEFQAAFPGASGWTNDHKLAGTTYSVIMCKPAKLENRYKVMRWRGPLGLGEPSVSIVANWSECYDPRTESYAFSKNPSLIWAWFRTHPNGRNKDFDSIEWARIGQQATICDQNVVGIEGTFNRWECFTAVPDSKERSAAEMEIMLSCDGQIVFNDDEKSWLRVGYYYEPSLTISRNRDIFAMSSVEAQNGESETQGVIVRYLDPAANYTAQSSAAWKNPLYYDPLKTAKYLTVDILSVQNHNQAMRLAKAIGQRSQPPYKIAPTVGLRGLRARRERIIDVVYDNTFAGPHEIVTPLEVDKSGQLCGFGAVPIDENRWTLLAGEELPKPVFVDSANAVTLAGPTSLVVTYDSAKLIATFDVPSRDDVRYRFRARIVGTTKWLNFIVDMKEQIGTLAGIVARRNYEIQYSTVTNGGKSTKWLAYGMIFTTIVAVTGDPVTGGKVGVAYAGFDVDATGGSSPYYFQDLYGRLPPGISINNSNGLVTGTPTTAGTYNNIVIKVTDADNDFNYLPTFAITIVP